MVLAYLLIVSRCLHRLTLSSLVKRRLEHKYVVKNAHYWDLALVNRDTVGDDMIRH